MRSNILPLLLLSGLSTPVIGFWGLPARLHARDSITIDIHNVMNNSSIRNAGNNAKFEVVNNAKSANIAMGDKSNHTATFDSFGDKNMMNSTGSNTGGWNTKNHGTNLSTGDSTSVGNEMNDNGNGSGNTLSEGDRNEIKGVGAAKRELVNLKVDSILKDSGIIRSGNDNSIELFVMGDCEDVVNITITYEAENSTTKDSGNGNVIRVFIGDATKEDMANNTIIIPFTKN